MQKRNVLRNLGMVAILSTVVAIGLNCLLLYADLAQYSERYQDAAVILYSPSFAEQILYSGIMIPIMEEVIFRGLVFRMLRRWVSFPWAMTISAVAFGVYHGNLVQFVYAGICGMLLAYLYEKYDSIVAPISSHMVMNIVAVVLTQMGVFSWIMGSVVRVLLITIICVAIGVKLLRLLHNLDVTKVLKIYCKDTCDDI